MDKRKGGIAGKLIAGIFLVLSLCFIGVLVYTKMIPMKVLLTIGLIMLAVVCIVGMLTWNRHKVVRFAIGTVLTVVLSAAYIFSGACIYKTAAAISEITGEGSGVAKTEESVQGTTETSAEQAAGQDTTATNETQTAGLDTTATGPEQTDAQDAMSTGAAQNAGQDVSSASESQAENPPTQSTDSTQTTTSTQSADEIKDCYTIYISGIDNRGGLIEKSRSDVNIIATLNTSTKQLLLVSTPRDYFVPLSISGGVPDKLTHAGIYGVDVCVDTLEMLYDIEIDYYVRMNFDGFINIIDALGGITVYSDYAFDSGSYHFDQGENTLNGEQALVFARERYAFAEGDRQRGKNQMAVIQGVIEKAMSPDLLKNLFSILSCVTECFETNVPYDVIAQLFQQQLISGGSWNVVRYSVDGTGDTQKPYSMSQKAYVMVPDYSTVDHAKELMQKVRDGEILE